MFLTDSFPKNQKLGNNFTRVDWGPVSVWYSYGVPIAFVVSGHPMVVRHNKWGPTTAKHINAIDWAGKNERVDCVTFARLWKEQVAEWIRDSALAKAIAAMD